VIFGRRQNWHGGIVNAPTLQHDEGKMNCW